MPRFSVLLPRWLAGLCLLGATALGVAEPQTVRVMMEHASPPFASRNAKGLPEGFAVDLLREIAADQNLHLEFDLRPWQTIYAEFREGRGDVLGLVASSEERAQHMDFSLPFEKLVAGIYQSSESSPLRNIADLRGKRVAVIKQAITHEFLARHPEWGVIITPFDSLGDCLQAVQRHDADATLGMRLVTDHQVRQLGLRGIVRGDLTFPEINYNLCFAVQPGQKALLAKINLGLYNLRVSRRHETLHETWLGPLEPPKLRWRDVERYVPATILVLAILLSILVWQRRLLLRVSEQARALRENEERLQLVFEGSQDGFWDWNASTGRIMRSPRWAEMLGYSLAEIPPGRNAFVELIHPDDRAAIIANEDRMQRGTDYYAHEFRMRAKSGEWKWILDRGKVVARDPKTGAPLRIAGTHTDVTDRRRAEEESDKLLHKMQEAQKLESLGVLSGGIAHDFNNLLSVILGNAAMARLDAGSSPANTARLDSIITASNRAAELCRQLLAYAGKASYTAEHVDLNQLITETARLLELSLSKQAKLEFALSPGLPRIEADPSQIRQVIMNLVINASEAIGESEPGTIRLATSAVNLPQAAQDASGPTAELEPGRYIRIEITDTGCGMSPDVLARIFDPFFTTKFTGRGLGLAAVQGIVRTHGGALQVFSTPGKGSNFRIHLPVSRQPTAHPFPGLDSGTKA